MKSLIGTDMAVYFFAMGVPLRTESICLLLTSYNLQYILLLDVHIGIMLYFYPVFNQHTWHQILDIIDTIFKSK